MVGVVSKIEWTEKTWNPVTGCTKVSAGCKHCYALTMAKRLKAMGNPRYQNDSPEGHEGFGVTLHHDKLDEPLHWRKPRRVFVNSMSDLFHEDVPFEFIADVFHTMTGECSYEAPPMHTYQILTKRPERMLEFFRWLEEYPGGCSEPHIQGVQLLWFDDRPHPRVWLGVSCEDQEAFDERYNLLSRVPAAVRFLSLEPLLGPIDLSHTAGAMMDWVIVGGESGPKCRPMNHEWAESIVGQCRNAGVPVFVKQLGGHPDKRGNPADWPKRLRVREWPS